MFEMMFPDSARHARTQFILSLLEDTEQYAIGRLRDAWLEPGDDDKPVIAVYTRNGGGNRQHSDPEHPKCTGCVMEKIVNHPLYLRDADDEFDTTYATIWFKMPEWLAEEILAVLSARPGLVEPERVDMSKKWREAIANLDKGPLPPHILAFSDQLAAALGIPTK